MGSLSNHIQEHCTIKEAQNNNGGDESVRTPASPLCPLKSSSFCSSTSSADTIYPSAISTPRLQLDIPDFVFRFPKTGGSDFSNIRGGPRSHSSAIRNVKKLWKIDKLSEKLPSAISNAFGHRKRGTKEIGSCLSDVRKRSSIDHNTNIFDPVAGDESESAGPSFSSQRSGITDASYVRHDNQDVVDDESDDPSSGSFRSAVAEVTHRESSQESIDFPDPVISDQMGPLGFNSRDQKLLPFSVEIKGNGKRKMGRVGYGLKSLKYGKRWKQTCTQIKLLSCSNLFNKKRFKHIDSKTRSCSSDSSDGKSTSFGSALCSSCSSLSGEVDEHNIRLMAQIPAGAMDPSAQVKLSCAGDDQEECWMKRILMGKRCRPLDASGTLQFDENGFPSRGLPENTW